jgi:hypothetical protein
LHADQIKQGESYTNCFPVDTSFLKVEDDDVIGNYSCQIDVKQYPDDESAISRSIPINSKDKFEFTLTPTETNDDLDVGMWYIIATITKTGREIEQTIRLTVQKKWA